MNGGNQCLTDIAEQLITAHNARVLGYAVDYDAQELAIRVEQQGKRLVMRFTGLVAHHFNHAGIRNVIYDIAAVPLDEFIDSERKWLTRTLRFGFPVTVRGGLDSLRRSLSEQGCQVFDIRASVGLCGFVIAQRLIIEPDTRS
ncbi:MAG: hypothetical protein ACOX8N_10455 [Christensenellales bacterium]|jgi:hypothetical protein